LAHPRHPHGPEREKSRAAQTEAERRKTTARRQTLHRRDVLRTTCTEYRYRVGGCGRALRTETKVEIGTSQSKSGTSVNLRSNSGFLLLLDCLLMSSESGQRPLLRRGLEQMSEKEGCRRAASHQGVNIQRHRVERLPDPPTRNGERVYPDRQRSRRPPRTHRVARPSLPQRRRDPAVPQALPQPRPDDVRGEGGLGPRITRQTPELTHHSCPPARFPRRVCQAQVALHQSRHRQLSRDSPPRTPGQDECSRAHPLQVLAVLDKFQALLRHGHVSAESDDPRVRPREEREEERDRCTPPHNEKGSKVAFAHALCHSESYAVNLMSDIIARFTAGG